MKQLLANKLVKSTQPRSKTIYRANCQNAKYFKQSINLASYFWYDEKD